jgi:hypothetical protein
VCPKTAWYEYIKYVSGKNEVKNPRLLRVLNPRPSPMKSGVLVHYAINSDELLNVKFIQYKIGGG